MDDEKRTSIKPPASNATRDATRGVVEGAAEIIPGVGVVTNLLRVTHPPKSETQREEWQEAISDRSNEHDTRLDRHEDVLAPRETLAGLPAQLLALLIQGCPDGLTSHYYDLDELCAFVPDEKPQDVEDATFDLKTLGLLKSHDWIGGWAVVLSEDAYEQVDSQVMGWDTAEDAVYIAKLMLSDDTGHAPELHEKTGWSKRRFNPAFRLLLPLFPEGRIRRVIQADYPSLGVILDGEDKANLRRFVARHERSR